MRHKPAQLIKAVVCRTVVNYLCPALVTGTLSICLLMRVSAVNGETGLDPENKEAELESLRLQIKDVESNIQAARNETDQIFKELQANEIAAVKISANLKEIDKQIETKVVRLAQLNVEKASSEEVLVKERGRLAEQVRETYKIGHNDYVKLLLNQEDPALVGRMLIYYDYYNRARTMRINKIIGSLEQITHLEESIQSETGQLDQLRTRQLAKLEEFTVHRSSRSKIISKLETYIEQQGKQLHILQQNEQELEQLVNTLREQDATAQLYGKIPSFNSLKGRLRWPVKGKFINRYGAPRKGGKLRWQGVTIATASGTDVLAISSGRVIFADWFRNLGLLIILDHGDGYMSLYGHNERLLRKVGDIVPANESIAKVGDTGGQQKPNLYFEIRKSGNPVNPGLWCKG